MIPENSIPIAAKCPSCGASLSETSVLALAPVCGHCGSVITKSGGTLGLTSAYGVNDPTITRKRVEADLAVFCDYRDKYVGMLGACKDQLNWGVERYAKFPNPPEFLSLQVVPPFSKGVLKGLGMAALTFFCSVFFMPAFYVAYGLLYVGKIFLGTAGPWQTLLPHPLDSHPELIMVWLMWLLIVIACWVAIVWDFLRPHYKAKAANGERPLENARRQKAYDEARAAALKDAELLKAAQDHRLRSQICELEGLITTMTEKAEDVRRILRTL